MPVKKSMKVEWKKKYPELIFGQDSPSSWPISQIFTTEVTLVVLVKLIKYKTACEVEIVICLFTWKGIIGFHCT